MGYSIFDHLQTHGNECEFVPQRMPAPTRALPGTPEKLAALKARVDAGEQLHHPADTKRIFDEDSRCDASCDEDVSVIALLQSISKNRKPATILLRSACGQR